MFDEMIKTFQDVINRLDDASHREEQLLRAVDRWLEQAADPNLTDAARATYMDCAEIVAGIYG